MRLSPTAPRWRARTRYAATAPSSTSPLGGSQDFPDLFLFHERERIVDILREHHRILDDGFHCTIHQSISSLHHVGLVIRPLNERDEADAVAHDALHTHLIDQEARHSRRTHTLRLRIVAATDQADERIAAAIR